MAVKQLKLTELNSQITSPVDVFICCASYEDRCRSIANAINPASIKKAILGVHKNIMETTDSIGQNLEYFEGRFEGKLDIVDLFTDKPIDTATNLSAKFNSLQSSGPLRYLVDITTFTHETLLITFQVLRRYIKPDDDVTLIYASAQEYCPGMQKDAKWLSYGVSEVRSILGYPGEILPMKKNHLIILVGYEHHRASELIEAYEPNRISLGYGHPGDTSDMADEGAGEYFSKLLQQSIATYYAVTSFEFNCSDPVDAKNSLLKEIGQFPDYNHIVAPMNTKISTIGSALAAIEDDTIQLCYAQARRYNMSHYSTPGEYCYLMSLSEMLSTS